MLIDSKEFFFVSSPSTCPTEPFLFFLKILWILSVIFLMVMGNFYWLASDTK